MSKAIYEGLNPAQKEAIFHDNGPLLVLAGAGSGKTNVITHRFAYLSSKHASSHVLAVTFTNKAGEEMKDRIAQLTKKDMRTAWVGTFHSICNRVLKKEIHLLGLSNDFSILDEDDQSSLIRHILKEFKIYEALYKGISARISLLKSSLIGPEKFLSSDDAFNFEDKLARVYVRYEQELKKCRALDFDDLILMTIRLLDEHPKALNRYCNLFQHVLVDEFQDTNHAQYMLMKLLASHGNLCAVVDDDQGIYAFRGADRTNIIKFKNDFPHAKLIKLEQNYRSTQHILDAAREVIKGNPLREPKNLWTDRKDGEKVYICRFNTEEEESKCIAKVVKELYLKGIYRFRDFAVLYRINLQARPLQEAMRDEKLPYRILGSPSLYQRKEIKDLLAYIHLATNPSNSVSLRRIINCPPRGIGTSTISKIEQTAKKKSISLFAAIKDLIETNAITPSMKEKVEEFIKTIEQASPDRFKNASEMLKHIYHRTGYADFSDEGMAKNITEFIASAGGVNIKEFIDRVSLITNMDDENMGNAVTLTTLHTAKGLEFPVVFIVGVEEGILPFFKAKEQDDIAEERRLLYVGMTRAKDILWLTNAKKRRLYTKIQEQQQSRFLANIPMECCQHIEKIAQPPVLERKIEVKTFKPILYAAGSRVRHPLWGIGVVRDCHGEGDEQKITVNFPDTGVKRLAIKFAQLERL